MLWLRDIIVIGALAGVVWYRLRTGKVPNVVTLGALGTAPLVQWATLGAMPGAREFVLGAGVGLIIGIFLRMLGAARAGDMKLLLGIGGLLGPGLLVDALLASGLLALVLGLSLAARRRILFSVLARVAPAVTLNPFVLILRTERDQSDGRVPLAVLIAIGTLGAVVVQRVVQG